MANSFNSTVTGPNIENPAKLFQLNSTNVQNGDIKSNKTAGVYNLNVASTGILSMETAMTAETPTASSSTPTNQALTAIPGLPSDASTKTYTLKAVNGSLSWVAN